MFPLPRFEKRIKSPFLLAKIKPNALQKGTKKQRSGIFLYAVGRFIQFFYGLIHCAGRTFMTMYIRTKGIFAVKQICVLSCFTGRTKLPGVFIHKTKSSDFLTT